MTASSSSFERPAFVPRRSLSITTRRGLVAIRMAFFGAALVWWVLLKNNPTAHLIGMVVFTSVHIGAGLALFWKSTVWHLGNAPSAQLDERQLQVRADAYTSAYQILAGVLLLVLVLLLDVFPGLAADLVQANGNSWLVLMMVSALNLPSDLLAWREREL